MEIIVCSRKKASLHVARNNNCNIISIVDCGYPHPEFVDFNRRLRLRFDDIDTPHDMGPSVAHVREIISFAHAIDERPLIVHCKAGISRSSAAAFIVYAVKFGPAGIRDHFRPMLGLIYPNAEMLRLADGMIGNDGALIAAGEHFRNWDLLVDRKDE
jgi:predicted protein tyrosine phosphatase